VSTINPVEPPADAATWAANGFDRLHVEVEARQQAADEAARRRFVPLHHQYARI
jgi:hypothetical protein